MNFSSHAVKKFLVAALILTPVYIGALDNVEIATEIGGPAMDTLKLPTAVAFDAEGKIYATDPGNFRARVFAKDGKFEKDLGAKGKLGGQFMEPAGVAWSDNLVFITDAKLDTVSVFNTAGQYLYQFGGSGTEPGKLKTPRGIVASNQGRIFVAESSGARISVYSTQGLYLGTLGESASLGSPTHIALDRSGNIYVTDTRANRIVVLDQTGLQLKVIDCKPLGIERAAGIAVTERGYIVVADAAGKIVMITPQGQAQGSFGSAGVGRGQFKDAAGVALSDDGRLAIADSANNRVVVLKGRYPTEGAALPPAKSLNRVGLEQPMPVPAHDVAVADNGTIFVLSEEGAVVTAYNRRGQEKFVIKPQGGGKSARVATGGGRVYVGDSTNGLIYAFSDENGKFLFQFGGKGRNNGQFSSPGGMAVRDKLYIADTGNDRVQVFSPDGVFLSVLADPAAPFKKPSDVTVGGDGKIYVADAGNKRIARFTAAGKPDGSIGDKDSFGTIVAVRVDGDGRIFILENDRDPRIRVFAPDGKLLMRIGSSGSGPADFSEPAGMDMHRVTLYIADEGNNRVQRIMVMDVPGEPTGFKIAAGPNSSLLTWKKGPESYLQGYRVWAVDDAGKKEAIAETEQTEFIVPVPLKGGQTKFTVTAFSDGGLESTPAPILTDWCRIGVAEARAGKLKEAVASFEKALDVDANDPFATEQLGRALVELKDYDRAAKTFEKLIPNRAWAEKGLLGLGMIALAKGDLVEAEKQLAKSLGYNSQNAETQRYLAEVYVAQQQWQKALDAAKEASVLDPMNPRPHEIMGLAYMNQRLYGKSGKSFGMAIALDPKNTSLYRSLAKVYKLQGQTQQAEEMLNKAAQAAPEDIAVKIDLGVLYLETNRLDDAEAQAAKAKSIDPKSASAYLLQGKVHFARGKKEDAIETFRKALELAPNDPEALVSLTMAYLEMNQLAEAAGVIDKARAIHPKNEAVLMASSKVKEASGDLTGAVAEVDEILKTRPDSVEALMAKGRLHMLKKEYQAAADVFVKASRLLPGTVEPLLLLAEALIGANKSVEAEEALRNALNINMESGAAHFALGKLYATRTEFDKAVPEFKLASYISPDSAAYHQALGKAYIETGDLEEAVTALQRASELSPASDEIKRDLNLALEGLKKYRSSGNVPPVEIAKVQMNPLFAGLAKSYQDRPLGTITIRNNGREELFKIKVSFKIKGYMEVPSVQMIDRLKPKTTIEVPIKLNLQKELTIRDDTPALGVVLVEYTRGKTPQKLTTTAPFTIYGPNALVWSDKAMIGAFVTPVDWPVAEFARGALDSTSGAPEAFPASLTKAVAVYEGLQAYKMSYLEDPNRPYRQSSTEVERVDYVQYPRDTLRLRSGDCDDLTILFMALMENLGVETALADVPGHVLPLVDAGVAPEDISQVAGDPNLVIEAGGKVWIPVEMTAVGVGFSEAWAEGAKTVRQAASDGKLTIVQSHVAWKTYAPATLANTTWKPTMPEKAEIGKRFSSEVNMISRKRIDRLAADVVKKLEADPSDAGLRIELGVLYAKNGDPERAREEFEKVVAADPNNADALNNLGNVLFMQENFQAALERYRAAETIKPDDPEIKINLAMAYYKLGNLEMAKEKFEAGAEADPDIAEANSILKELLYH